jgi:hypothetical protein
LVLEISVGVAAPGNPSPMRGVIVTRARPLSTSRGTVVEDASRAGGGSAGVAAAGWPVGFVDRVRALEWCLGAAPQR